MSNFFKTQGSSPSWVLSSKVFIITLRLSPGHVTPGHPWVICGSVEPYSCFQAAQSFFFFERVKQRNSDDAGGVCNDRFAFHELQLTGILGTSQCTHHSSHTHLRKYSLYSLSYLMNCKVPGFPQSSMYTGVWGVVLPVVLRCRANFSKKCCFCLLTFWAPRRSSRVSNKLYVFLLTMVPSVFPHKCCLFSSCSM